MWSSNKKIDFIINALLLLVGMNFLHYGQFILPIICLILFVDNKFNFRVNNIKTFVLLCIFAVAFCAFSYKLGFYCVMGFTLPMAYYIGSNMKNVNEDNIVKVIYIISLGMIIHLMLNFVFDFYCDGIRMFGQYGHKDIWTGSKVQATITATNYVLPLSLMYYILIYEKNKIYKISYFVLLAIVMVYELALGRRTPIFIMLIGIACSTVIDKTINKNKLNEQKILKPFIILLTIALIIIVFVWLYYTKVVGDELHIIDKINWSGLTIGRFEYLSQGFKLARYHLWGGREISDIMGMPIHDLWSDIYDYSGIIPYIIFILCTLSFVKIVLNYIKSKMIMKENKVLMVSLFVCIFAQLCIEPIFTSCSLFLICSIIILSLVESIKVNEK